MEQNTPNQGSSESAIRFNCAFCGQQIRVSPVHAGKKAKCPKCKNIVIIPQPAPEAQQPREEEPIRLKRDPEPPPRQVGLSGAQAQDWYRRSQEPTANAVIFSEPPEPKPATILDVFTFPFSLAGVLHFILFWFAPLLLWVASMFAGACCYLYILVLGFCFALIGYFFYYLSCCVIAAARDERFAPDMSFDDTPGFFDLLRRVFLILGGVLICFIPLILYIIFAYVRPAFQNDSEVAFYALRTDPWYWITYGLGVFLLPMFFLAVVLFDSITALNPVLIITSIAGTFVPYCGLAILFCVIGLVMNFLGRSQPGIGVISFFAWGIDIYLMFIAAYILGRFFRRYESKLNWEVKL